VLVAALGVVGFGPASLLVLVGETRPGRLFGGVSAGVLVAAACLGHWLFRSPARSWPWLTGAGLGLSVAVGLALVLIREAPEARPDRDSGLVSRFTGGAGVPRLSPMNLIPEIDQARLGLTMATRLVPWVGRARTIREVMMGLYREIEADPDARGLGPVSHFAAMELVGAEFDSGHYFAYVPVARPGETLGAVVFLHGNGGNFQAAPWAWRPFAEEHRVAILCPTYGFGFWGEGGVEAVDRAWADASRRWPIDPHRVYLAGLSDGGVGVTRSGLAHPERYRGLIYLSPTMHLDELASPGFVEGWKGRPIRVFQGDRDWSVSKSTVDPAVDLLRRQGSAVEYDVFSGEDHFLFFSRRLEIFERLGAWMAGIERPLAVEKAGER
jgi:pimeloyl-ACP methyl ester carboxylesterase